MKLSILYPFTVGQNVSLLTEDAYHGGTEISGDVADMTASNVILIVNNGKEHAIEIIPWSDIHLCRVNDGKRYGYEEVLDTAEMQSLKTLAENIPSASERSLANCLTILESCGVDNPEAVLSSLLFELTQNDFSIRQYYMNKEDAEKFIDDCFEKELE